MTSLGAQPNCFSSHRSPIRLYFIIAFSLVAYVLYSGEVPAQQADQVAHDLLSASTETVDQVIASNRDAINKQVVVNILESRVLEKRVQTLNALIRNGYRDLIFSSIADQIEKSDLQKANDSLSIIETVVDMDWGFQHMKDSIELVSFCIKKGSCNSDLFNFLCTHNIPFLLACYMQKSVPDVVFSMIENSDDKTRAELLSFMINDKSAKGLLYGLRDRNIDQIANLSNNPICSSSARRLICLLCHFSHDDCERSAQLWRSRTRQDGLMKRLISLLRDRPPADWNDLLVYQINFEMTFGDSIATERRSEIVDRYLLGILDKGIGHEFRYTLIKGVYWTGSAASGDYDAKLVELANSVLDGTIEKGEPEQDVLKQVIVYESGRSGIVSRNSSLQRRLLEVALDLSQSDGLRFNACSSVAISNPKAGISAFRQLSDSCNNKFIAQRCMQELRRLNLESSSENPGDDGH